MSLDSEDMVRYSADGGGRMFRGGKTSVGFDYKSNLELAKNSLNLDAQDETVIEDLEDLVKNICLNKKEPDSSEKSDDLENSDDWDESDDSDPSDNSDRSEEENEMVTRAPIGGEPVAFADAYGGKLMNGSSCDLNLHSPFISNSQILDSKSKRSFNDREFHAVKYKKPTEQMVSMLELQCSTIDRFPNNNIIQNSHQTSGGIMTITPSPPMVTAEDYDSGFSPSDGCHDSPLEYPPIVSPSSDYGSMASPPYNDPSVDPYVKQENFGEIWDEKFNDVCEIIAEELNQSRIIKEEKERLEKVLSGEDKYLAFSPPQHVPQQGSMPSSSPPSLYTELNNIIGDLLSSDPTLPVKQNQTPNQSQFYSQQPPPPPPPPPVTTYAQPHQSVHVNSNHLQFTQQQLPQIVTSPSQLQYSVQPQQPNVFSKTSTQQPYPAQQILSTNGNQYVLPNSQVYSHSEQAVLNSALLNYIPQNQQSTTPVSNQRFTSQQQRPIMQNNKPCSLAHFPQAQPSQIITTTTASNQHFTLPQHQNLATPKYTTSPSQQRVTVSQDQVTGCTIQATQPAIQQLTPVLQQLPSNPSVVTQNSVVPLTSVPTQDGIATPVTSSLVLVAQPANPSNSFVFLPTTSVIFPTVPVTTKKSLRNILPKPANSDPNGNQLDPKKLSSQAGKGRRDKDKSSKQCESPGQSKLSVARRCVADLKEDELEGIDEEGDNYLHVAVCKTDVYMVEALLERLKRSGKLDIINKQNKLGQTPVYLAVSTNQPAMVHKLIRYGADVNIKGMTHDTQKRVERAPIHCAASQGKEFNATLKEIFTSDTIDPDILNSDGLSALHCAIIEHGKLNPHLKTPKIDNCQNVTLLLKHKSNANLPDRCNGKTPLMYAIESKDYSLVDIILKGVDSSKISELLTAKTFDGHTCMKIADGLQNKYDPQTWRKLRNVLSNAN